MVKSGFYACSNAKIREKKELKLILINNKSLQLDINMELNR